MDALSEKIAEKFTKTFGSPALPDRANRLLSIAVLTIIYYFAARWSLLLAFEGTNASPIWPPSGIALGAMLLLGPRIWPAITIGAFAANMVVFSAVHVIDGPTAALMSLCVAIGNTLEACCGFYLLRRLNLIYRLLSQPQHVFKFMMTALIMCVISAIIGTASLISSGVAPITVKWPVWINWWLGDVGGVLIMTPLIYTWLVDRSPRLKPQASLEFMALMLVLMAAAIAIFGGYFSAGHADRLLLYVFIPGLAWAAYRFGQRGVSLSSLLIASVAIWGTTRGLGPFVMGDLNNSLILLVSFIVLYCVTGLVLAADITQRINLRGKLIGMHEVMTPWITLMVGLAVTILAWHLVSSGTENATLRVTALPAFEVAIDSQKAQIILIAGLFISLLLFILVRSLAMTRENALALADVMTIALRESETRLRLVNNRMALATEAGGIGVWDWDIKADILVWDERMYEIYQIPPGSASNTYEMWREHIYPDDLEFLEVALREALAGVKPYAPEFRIVMRDGTVRRIKANARISRDEAGQPRHMIGINFDITDLREAEESLVASEKRFRNILENAPIGMAIVSLEWRYLEVNSALCDIVGYSKDELEHLTFKDITHPEDKEKGMDQLQKLIEGSLRSYQIEKRYIRKDGRVVWVLVAVSLIRDEQNVPLYFISQVEDISELKLSEAKLQETLALRSAILSSANQIMIATDTEGLIVSFNRAAERMLGYDRSEVIGIHTPLLIHDAAEVEKHAKALSKELNRSIASGFDVLVVKAQAGVADENEWIYVRKDGTRFPVLLSVTAIRNQAGGITGYLGVASDISDRKQKEQIIRTALVEKETLIKEVYHRVKNNLQVISSLFNLQLSTLSAGPARTALEQGAERVYAMSLVHQKLYQSDNLSSIRLDNYIRDLCQQMGQAAAIEQRGIGLLMELEPVDIGLETAVPLGLLLNELISNSLKHAFPDGRQGEIKVQLSRTSDSMVRLVVSDNGIGMPAGLDHESATTLGLKLIYTLSGQLDAKMEMESDQGTSDQGTIVKLTFRVSNTS